MMAWTSAKARNGCQNAIDILPRREEIGHRFTFEHMNSDAFLQISQKVQTFRLKKIFATISTACATRVGTVI